MFELRSRVRTLRSDRGLVAVLAQHLPRELFEALKPALAGRGHRLILDS